MNRPWKVWLSFLLVLAFVVPAMGWLTHKAIELDHQVTGAARADDLEEDISLALWRMDVALAPLVAQEAARPYVVYRPFLVDPLTEGTKGSVTPQVSPLLVQPSEFVRLHFQLNANGELSSPQCPSGPLQELAVENGAPLDNIQLSCLSLATLSETVVHDELVVQLPRETLPPFEVTDLAWDNRLNTWNFNSPENANDLNQQVLVQNTTDSLEQALANSELQQTNAAPNVPPNAGQPQQDQLSQAPSNLPNPQMAGPQFPNNLDAPQQSEAGPQGGSANQSRQPTAEGWNEQYAGNYYGYGRAPRAQTQRGQLEYQRRNKALQSYANAEVVRQRKQLPLRLPTQTVREGVSAPLWIDSELLLARRVKVDGQEIVQGCWFDWDKLKQFLIAEGSGQSGPAAVSLPNFDLRPIAGDRNVSPARRLATLPVEIVVPTPKFTPATLSPIRISLGIAWACMFLATLALAVMLAGVIRLSERRGAFVAAVTHELRTPLTTFRMYAEMLSEGMVRDRQQQQEYTDTLRVEADRLTHLVENVLAYAQLERGRKGGRREEISLSNLISRMQSRLDDRARQGQMKLETVIPEEVADRAVETDPQAVEQILFNLVDNACKYAQSAEDRTIRIEASLESSLAVLRVSDAGPGISKAFTKRLFQPFSKSVEDAAHSAPGVGLGLALCRRLAREIGSGLLLEETKQGACFRVTIPLA